MMDANVNRCSQLPKFLRGVKISFGYSKSTEFNTVKAFREGEVDEIIRMFACCMFYIYYTQPF